MIVEKIRSYFRAPAHLPTEDVHRSKHMSQSDVDFFDANGFLHIKNAMSSSEVDGVLEAIERFRESPESGPDKSEYNDRIGQIHQVVDECFSLASKSHIVDRLKCILKDEPLLFGSLSFSKGTEQQAHIDSIFFYTEPVDAMVGVWFAMEDIEPDSGPLFYYPGSHKWDFTRGEDVVENFPEFSERVKMARKKRNTPESQQLVSEMGASWTKDLHEKIDSKQASPTPGIIKKGDCIIWHALLVHGGMPVINPELSRKSIVFHYIGLNSRLYTFEDFFLKTNQEILKSRGIGKDIQMKNNLNYMKQPCFSRYDKLGRELPQQIKN